MITEIGITAGDIWHYLDAHNKSNLRDVVRGIDKPKDLALMSVGWLAREGHVVVEKEGSDYKVWLREG
jgi:hypothetical protein